MIEGNLITISLGFSLELLNQSFAYSFKSKNRNPSSVSVGFAHYCCSVYLYFLQYDPCEYLASIQPTMWHFFYSLSLSAIWSIWVGTWKYGSSDWSMFKHNQSALFKHLVFYYNIFFCWWRWTSLLNSFYSSCCLPFRFTCSPLNPHQSL